MAKNKGLLAFRVVFGLWLMAAPWAFGHHFDGFGVSNALAGLAVIASAPFCDRWLAVRYGQALISAWILFVPFIFDVKLLPTYNNLIIGKTLLLAAIASSEIFSQRDDEEPARPR
jgi:hypothetical protein